jgi:hypothetical protein
MNLAYPPTERDRLPNGRKSKMSNYPRLERNLEGKEDIHFLCLKCESPHAFPLKNIGLLSHCYNCGQEFKVPKVGSRFWAFFQQEGLTTTTSGQEFKVPKVDSRFWAFFQQEGLTATTSEQAHIGVGQVKEEILQPQENDPLTSATVTNQRREKACEYCGEAILETAKKCKHCGEFLDSTSPPGQVQCRNCHAVVKPQRMQSGCGTMFIIALLLCLGIIPGVIYIVWDSSRKQCPNCKLPIK